jgi:hypothetical protein
MKGLKQFKKMMLIFLVTEVIPALLLVALAILFIKFELYKY